MWFLCEDRHRVTDSVIGSARREQLISGRRLEKAITHDLRFPKYLYGKGPTERYQEGRMAEVPCRSSKVASSRLETFEIKVEGDRS
jgi:hypothetical protein